ncbi:hypothetical protein [Roseisalinus antarcticus]|uniref:Uncharacterized protein n=1 Tax=Roseisalinus antarcticus TaxID=254357 RepID=A0A1Y5U1X0_9RHOB|nr:hypothetical protein [Roseisalinus antarcticus]SLN76637.1 hypothetical protein ROA7023_04219 [Roseisalinus antarcticus]
MGKGSRWIAAWAVVLGVAVVGNYLSTWAMIPLVRTFSAHSDASAATLIVLLRVVLWIVILGFAIWLAAKLVK